MVVNGVLKLDDIDDSFTINVREVQKIALVSEIIKNSQYNMKDNEGEKKKVEEMQIVGRSMVLFIEEKMYPLINKLHLNVDPLMSQVEQIISEVFKISLDQQTTSHINMQSNKRSFKVVFQYNERVLKDCILF